MQVTIDDCASEFSTEVPLLVTGDLISHISSVNAYPCPAQDYLELPGISGELLNVLLVDLAGKSNTIEFEKRGDVYRADIQHLAQGAYLLVVIEEHSIQRIKVFKK